MITVTLTSVEFIVDLSSLSLNNVNIGKNLGRFESEIRNKYDTYGVELDCIDATEPEMLILRFEVINHDNFSYKGNQRLATLIKNIAEKVFNGK